MKTRFLVLPLILWLGAAPLCAQTPPQRFDRHFDGVLGTSLDLTLFAPEGADMEGALVAAQQEIDRLDLIFSSYRDDSELMRLNRERSLTNAAPELLEVLALCAQWEQLSQGRFNCKLGRPLAAWREAQRTQTLPDRAALQSFARAAAARIEVDSGKRGITLPDAVDLELSGIAKGYIIDRTLAVLRNALRDASAIKVDIGGDATYWGRPPLSTGWRVGIADPNAPSDSRTIATLDLQNMAIASSGHVSRYYDIGGQHFSHILNSTTGWALEPGIGTGTVALAPTAAAADAAATAMTLQSATDAAAWASALPELDALVVAGRGKPHVSDLWNGYVATVEVDAREVVLRLDFTIPTILERGGYHRPYVAIWVSDPAQAPLKHLLMLGEDGRWAIDNTRWWRRAGRITQHLVEGTARPTRAPGEYRVEWDGRSDTGKPLPPGDYLLHVEAVRQDGGHDYQRLNFSLGGAPQSQEVAGSGELGRIRLQVGDLEK